MLDRIEALASQAFAELEEISTPVMLEEWRVRYLGRKSDFSQILRSLSTLAVGERRFVGAKANELKVKLEDSLTHKKNILEDIAVLSSQSKALDITLPGQPFLIGRLHPVTQILNEICGIFTGMGFQIAEGPEVEWEHYNFEALNMPADHAARDAFATLWVDYESEPGHHPMLLRTHTSPVQIRIMEQSRPPIRIIAPGRVYRYEATDATHEWMFNQVEGLAVDTNITMADLKGTLFEFARCLFGKDRKVRFRCDYFPFVEPGVDMAVDCFICAGAGCRLCGDTGWIEIMGAGMVHPEVLKGVGIDPDIYTGFAFGMGVERIPLLRYGIDDIRLFFGNDLKFLQQF